MPKRLSGRFHSMGNHSHPGYQCLALSVILDALRQWNKSGAPEAKKFLEGDMFPFLEAADLELDDVRLRQALINSGLVPLEVKKMAKDGKRT